VTSAYELLRAYALCNPHAAFTLDALGTSVQWAATAPTWQKWCASDPTSAHWYTAGQLRGLIAAYLASEETTGRARTVRELIAEFRGLSGTGKQKAIAEGVGLAGARLRDLVRGGDLDLDLVQRLLAAMQAASRPVPPLGLGVLGSEHLTEHLVRHHMVERDSVRYKRISDTDAAGLPFVLEVAFGVYTQAYTGCGRTLITGINWAPTLTLPFQRMPFLLGEVRADGNDPIVLVAHLACPQVQFTDRGKGLLDAS
jgi:hypothetical protein